MNILVSQSLYSSWEWASILVGIEPPWFCLGDICENRHILSSPCRISGAIAGFARYACSHIIAEAKQVYMEWLILHWTVGSTVSRLFNIIRTMCYKLLYHYKITWWWHDNWWLFQDARICLPVQRLRRKSEPNSAKWIDRLSFSSICSKRAAKSAF